MDFSIILTSIPPWISKYSTSVVGSVHRIVVSMKVEGDNPVYLDFVTDLCSLIPCRQYAMLK
jgi:hypothetical protein